MMAQLPEELLARLGRLAESEGLELVAVEITGASRRPVVRLVLDRASGVTLADCETVSRQTSAILDTYDPFPGSYSLEVSSPGLDRKLYSDSDYTRFAGEVVKVRMRPTWRGPRILTGVLKGTAGNAVRVSDTAGTEHLLPVHEIFEARLAPFADPPRPTPKGKRKQR
jgi:ribosome maturation factor RimP